MLYRTIARCDYTARCSEEMSFTGSTIIDIITELACGWTFGLNPITGATGTVPLSFLDRISCYDGLEEYWDRVQHLPRVSLIKDTAPITLPSTYRRPSGSMSKVVPVLGLVISDFCGSSAEELSVFTYYIVQIVGDTLNGNVRVLLHIPGEDHLKEGFVPRSIIEVQQIARDKCLRNRIAITDDK